MTPAETLERALQGDVRALGRAITLVQDGGRAGLEVLAGAYPRAGKSRVVGLTGPPGVGKSTLVDRLTGHYRRLGLKVGILAVDPSSPFGGGAILGDRIRMTEHFTDPGVFIRSMATRGQLGGLAAASADVIDLLDAAGHDVILVETIGVGQEDIEVSRVVPVVLLLLSPGLGDEIQVMKSGVMEIGDVYVVNKADLPGADRAEASLRSVLEIAGLEQARPVVRVSATNGEGIAELALAIDATPERLGAKEMEARALLRARERVAARVRAGISRKVESVWKAGGAREETIARVARREIDPAAAAGEALAELGIDG